MELTISNTQFLTRRTDALQYTRRFRHRDRFLELCRECPNFGNRWGCPPFDDNPQPDLSLYKYVELYMIKVFVEPCVASSRQEMTSMMADVIQRVRKDYESRILDDERRLEGRAALFTGLCPHCPGDQCARSAGRPCRHPDLVRPSLEALGFDLELTAREFFDTDILWASGSDAPGYICLVAALFF